MKKYILASILAVAPGLASGQVLNTVAEDMSAATAAVESGDIIGGHELAAKIMDGIGSNGGSSGIVCAGEKTESSKFVSEAALKKTNLNIGVVPMPGKEKSSLNKMLKSDTAECSVGGFILGLAMVAAFIIGPALAAGYIAANVAQVGAIIAVIAGMLFIAGLATAFTGDSGQESEMYRSCEVLDKMV